MDELTSPRGSIALAVSVLLVVLGVRLARPDRVREWVAVCAYSAALVAQLLGARGLLPGAVLAPRPTLRVAGALLLVVGILLAGKRSRAGRRAALAGRPEPAAPSAVDAVYVGLALVVAGQLARGPSVAGGLVAVAAILVCALVAASPRAPALTTRAGGGGSSRRPSA